MQDIGPSRLPGTGPIRAFFARLAARAALLRHIDSAFYGQQLGRRMSAGAALDHYLSIGWHEGFDPSPQFSTRAYTNLNPDAAGENPLMHFVRHGQAEGRAFLGSGRLYDVTEEQPSENLIAAAANGLDVDFYVNQTRRDFSARDAVVHYLAIGWKLGLDPSPSFSTDAYLVAHPELVGSGENPLLHYITERKPDSPPPMGSSFLFDAEAHPLAVDVAGPFVAELDPDFYARQTWRNLSPLDATRHYLASGWKHGLDPSPDFSSSAYLRNNPDVVEAGMNPLVHYIEFGRAAGRLVYPSNRFLDDLVQSPERDDNGIESPRQVLADIKNKVVDGMAEWRDYAYVRSLGEDTHEGRRVSQGSLTQNPLRTIAFYLPQYHPIPENDAWWGKGFTDWTNLTSAAPNFEGHLQPRVPAELGYYDLRLPSVMEQQAALARSYGLAGFCYYYYNFSGKRLLEAPLEAMLKTGRPDFPFCLCWANENWTRRWDGRSRDVLMEQSYSDDSLLIIARDILRYCRAPNYIAIDGKPLILIYRVTDLPDPCRTTDAWRRVAREEGIGEIVIASVESFNLSSRPIDPATFGCDLSVEFPPHDMITSPPLNVEVTNDAWTGTAHDYRALAASYMTREEPAFRRLRSVLVGWDNTPRYRDRSIVLEKATPGAFQAWLEWTMRRTLERNRGDERIVFINAWNEWCEGSYLEPDQHFGHSYLQALKNALNNINAGN